jgi:hypothetical protein
MPGVLPGRIILFCPAARIQHRIFSFWDGLHHSAITGESGFTKVFAQPLFDYLGTHSDVGPIFDAAMVAIHGHETPAMLDAYDFSAVRVLADIGGGNGSLIAATLQRYPKLKGLLFELDHVIRRTRESLKAYGVEDRCSVIEGNFFESLPSGADTCQSSKRSLVRFTECVAIQEGADWKQ